MGGFRELAKTIPRHLWELSMQLSSRSTTTRRKVSAGLRDGTGTTRTRGFVCRAPTGTSGESGPIFEKIKTLLQTPPMVSSRAWKAAVYYALGRWDKLTRFLEHGEVKIDRNLVENRIRPIALGRKNDLFAGSYAATQRTAILYSLLNTCLLHESQSYAVAG